MSSRREALAAGAALLTTGFAGCGALATDEPERVGGGRSTHYPLLAEPYVDERRPFDAHVLYGEELAREDFHWEDSWDEGITHKVETFIEESRDLLVIHVRVNLNEDATQGFPFAYEFGSDGTVLEPREGPHNVPVWQGPESWDAEAFGETYYVAFDGIPAGAGDRVDLRCPMSKTGSPLDG